LYIDGVLDTTKTMTSPTPNGAAFAIGAIYVSKSNIQDFFKGDIDEIRIWDTALTTNQLRYVMNQELEKAVTVVNGAVVPNTITKNEIEVVNWTNLLAYYNMNSYIGTHLNDVSGNGNRGSLTDPDQFTLEYQSSPLPYSSLADGNWDTATTWQNGGEQYIPGSPSIVDPNITVDWNIIRTNHNITMDNTSSLPSTNKDVRTVLSLMIDTNEVEIIGDNATDTGNALTVTHYLSIDGKLDLEGESQLIQTTGSDFNPASSGTLERDQQGTQDLFTYNYWSSPVGVSNTTTNNNSYTVPDIFNDGTNPAAPGPINFLTTGYDGTLSPLGIADFWIWKYSNDATSYYNWQHVRSTGTLLAGEGFSMKGVNNTNGNVALEQNYTLEGKPNNGDITLPITAGNSYLVGNPYASAIDAHQFILDNAPVIENAGATSGTLYFWEHWGGGTHVTAEYQGGYATYNLSGGVPAATLGNNTLGSGGTPTKLPGRYIAVAQGFFVGGEATGNIVFNNGQRAFQKEDITNSIFVKNTANNITTTSGDERLKIRLGFSSVNELNRQLLVTVDTNASLGLDYGYDGEHTETQMDDMYWMMNDKKYVIQGINTIEDSTILPIGVHTNTTGINTFKVDELINAPNDLEIYIYDTVTELYHDVKTNDFSINLEAGEYLDRFELRFSNDNVLSVEDVEINNDILFYFANNNKTIVIENPKLENIKSVELFNVLGQSIIKIKNETRPQEYIEFETAGISTGNYILELKTETGKLSKKVLIE
ncbi:LamG-like jellyroll fold domain-containing protein, partial [Pontimicrobium sp. MEBiC01747]